MIPTRYRICNCIPSCKVPCCRVCMDWFFRVQGLYNIILLYCRVHYNQYVWLFWIWLLQQIVCRTNHHLAWNVVSQSTDPLWNCSLIMQISLLPIPKWNNTTGLALQIGLENLQSQLLIFVNLTLWYTVSIWK